MAAKSTCRVAGTVIENKNIMIPTEKTNDYDYIAKYWPVLAASAWRDYRTHGRGAMLILGRDAPTEETYYVPLKMLSGDPLMAPFARFVKEYDPSTEIVAVFLEPPCRVSAYRGGIPERGAPPECFEKIKPALCEN